MEQKRSVVDEIRRPRTIKDFAADRVAKTVGSWSFVLVQTVLVLTWVIINSVMAKPWDPYPFVLMNVLLSLQAAYTAPFILMSQNRQGAIDRVDAQLDYETNRLTSRGVQQILERLEENARETAELKQLLAASFGIASQPRATGRHGPLHCVPPPANEVGLGEASAG